jgi:hypothetical protein
MGERGDRAYDVCPEQTTPPATAMQTLQRILRRLLIAVIAVIAPSLQPIAIAQQPARLSVAQQAGSYVLTVPASKLSLSIPSQGLIQGGPSAGGATNNPRYFYFSDEARGLILSGWFEPAGRFPGLESNWQLDQAAWKKNGLPPPADVSFGKVGDWEVVFYEQPMPDTSNSHVRAHLVRAGTWIDVHISVTTKGAGNSNRQAASAFLGALTASQRE